MVYLAKGLASKEIAWRENNQYHILWWGLQQTKRFSVVEHSQVKQNVQSDVYLGNCLSGVENIKRTLQRADEFKVLIDCEQPSNLSTDDCSINVAGMKWFPKEDLLALVKEDKKLSSSRTLYHSN